MNHHVCSGILKYDLELKYGKTSGKAWTSGVISVMRESNNSIHDDWRFVAFENVAATMARYCVKGGKIIIEDEPQRETYTDKNGVSVKDVKLVVKRWEFADDKRKHSESTEDAPPPDDNDFDMGDPGMPF